MYREMGPTFLRNTNGRRRSLWSNDASLSGHSTSPVLALACGNSHLASVWLAVPRDLSCYWLGLLPEESQENHCTLAVGRDISNTSLVRRRNRMGYYCNRESQLARYRGL